MGWILSGLFASGRDLGEVSSEGILQVPPGSWMRFPPASQRCPVRESGT
jgi:hypothetical protein